MKHAILYFFAFVTSFFACQALSAQDVWEMKVKKTDGTTTTIPISGIENVTFVKETTTDPISPATPGQAIDLGLSVKWASYNIGASKPEDYGDYYAWGETEEKTDYSESTYQYYKNGSYIHIGDNICGTQYDVAHVKWGGKWRMPSKAELGELSEKCTWEWATLNEVDGYLVTGPNGNSIFLPAAGTRNKESVLNLGVYGCYWLGNLNNSSLYGNDPEKKGYAIFFNSERLYADGDGPTVSVIRLNGLPIRPVSD